MVGSILLLQVSQVLGRGLFILFSFFYINHHFGLEAKGEWAGLFALFGILSACSNLGFEVWLTREVAGGSISRNQALSFLFKAKGLLWLPALLLGAVWVYLDGYHPLMAVAFGLALIFEGVALAEQAVFEGKSLAMRIAVMSFIKSGGFAMVAFAVALFAPSSLTLFAWFFAATLLGRAAYGWRAWRLLPQSSQICPNRPWRAFILMGSFTVVTIIYFKIDILMLASIQGRVAAGNYDNAFQFVEGVMFISAAAGTMLYPRLVQVKGLVKAQLFDTMFKTVSTLGFCGALSIELLAEPFGFMMIGEVFQGAVVPLTILGFALPIMFVNGLLNRWLFSEHRERFALACACGVALFNLVANLLVIPSHGVAGAALTTVLTEAILLVLWCLWGRRSPALLFWCLAEFGVLAGIHALAVSAGQWVFAAGLLAFSILLVMQISRLHKVSIKLERP